MTAVPATVERVKRPPMSDRHDLPEFRLNSDRDMLVLALSKLDQGAAVMREIRLTQTDIQKELGTLRMLVDRHDNQLLHLERLQVERKSQIDHLDAGMHKMKDDVMGRFQRLESERLDPLEQKLNAVKAWIAGAVAVLVFLWVFLAPIYTRLLDVWMTR